MRQAVVLIHGIGEQRPMETLRGFVSAIIQKLLGTKTEFWSKPDPMSDLFELRRLGAPGLKDTHFYEYYWAYQVEGTKITHVITWFIDLLGRGKKDIPEGLHTIWLLIWFITGLVGITLLLGGFNFFFEWYSSQPKYGTIYLVSLLVLFIIQSFLVYYVGDAARYLSSHPMNINLRQKIRKEGKILLRKLHSGQYKYDRIIVVGHSLGSVIAYDLITQLWIDYNRKYDFKPDNQELQDLLSKGEPPQPYVRSKIVEATKGLDEASGNVIAKFQEAQRDTFLEQRKWGNPWRITDFISVGSPLAHSVLLSAKSKTDFEERKHQRELPTCPPVKDKKGYAYTDGSHIEMTNGKKFSPLFLHHASPFAVTRWTNIYFPAYFGFFGDIIGGPLRKVFGLGIKDVPVKTNSIWRYTLFAHTMYWQPFSQKQPKEKLKNKDERELAISLQAIIDALDLNGKYKYR